MNGDERTSSRPASTPALQAGVDRIMIRRMHALDPLARAAASLKSRLAGTGRPSLSITIRLDASVGRLQSMTRRETSGHR